MTIKGALGAFFQLKTTSLYNTQTPHPRFHNYQPIADIHY